MRRVTTNQIEQAIAAYPAGGLSGVRNVFGGRVGASRATVFDYALVCTPGAYWGPADLARLYRGLQQRGLIPSGTGKPYADLAGFAPDGTPIDNRPLSWTCHNPLHTQEFLRVDAKHGYHTPDGGKAPWIVRTPDGGYALSAGFVAYATNNGINLQQGYPIPAGGFPETTEPAAPARPDAGMGKAKAAKKSGRVKAAGK